MIRKIFIPVAMAVLLLFDGSVFVPTAMAETQEAKNEQWQFELTPYLFAAGMNGTLGVRGVSSDIDMSFEDIWDRLDQAFMMLFTAQKGDWIIAADGMYINLDDEQVSTWQGPLGNTNTAQLNADLTQQIYALSAGKRVLNKSTKVDILGVARYTSVDTKLKLTLTTGADLLPDGSREVGRKDDWWDGAIAVRVVAPFAEKWNFAGYADIGAGGADLTYQLLAGVNWQFSEMLSTKLGYRLLYQDYSKDDIKWDMTTSGVYAGLGIRF
jgi:opacity protein-like surface antigen